MSSGFNRRGVVVRLMIVSETTRLARLRQIWVGVAVTQSVRDDSLCVPVCLSASLWYVLSLLRSALRLSLSLIMVYSRISLFVFL